jgi:hypothetical protein
MLKGPLAKEGYDWWWHSFTAKNKETKEERAFFIEFFVCNPELGMDEPIFGQKKLAKNPLFRENQAHQINQKESLVKPSYVMVKVGSWGKQAKQLHNFYGINHAKIAKNKLGIKVGDCVLSETRTQGEVLVTDAEEHPEYMCDNGSMKWDLKIKKKKAFHVGYGAAPFFRRLNAFKMFWHAEGIETEYEGKILWDGMEYEVIPEESYGYADKNWGGDFTSPWVWLSSCNVTSRVNGKKLSDTVFDCGGGCPIVLGVPLKRKLLSLMIYEGKDYEFNFSRFWDFVRTKFDFEETDTEVKWHVETKTWKSLMIIDCTCKKDEMLWINYEAPDGRKRHNKLWNGGTGAGRVQLYEIKGRKKILIDDMDFKNAGCEYGEYSE